MNAYEKYYAAAREQLEKVYRTQRGAIEQAATWLGEALVKDRWLYAFGTGHSHMLAEEIFYRAGGLARASPVLEDLLMLHKEAIEATYLERREGYAAELLKQYPMEGGDVLIVASNSGRNAVPIELAMGGTQRGMKVVVITNLAHTRAWPSRHSSGKKLADVGDVVIDNCGVHGDACLELPGIPAAIGPTSSITGMFIVNAIVAQGIENALSRGVAPEIYISSNSNGDEHNDKLLRKYKSRIRHL
ncbi:MAG: hypothetical protein DME19_01275 [Verrucomicrobia bacterium]|nr:MAG: hypothetical protein DME19_01275 [Verrucomicrobiota bacterium]